jgi:HEAT repeat protein
MTESGLVLLYHPDDAYFAARIGADLKQRGVAVWVDFIDQTETVAIETAIAKAAGFVPLLSASFDPAHFPSATLDGVNVLPLVVGTLDSWPKTVRRELAIDFTDWEIPERYALHLNETVRVLQNHMPGLVGAEPGERERYLYALMGDLYRGAGVYVPLPVHAEPVEDDESVDANSGELVLRANDNLGERIARNREIADAMAASDTEGLMQLPSAAAMLRFAPAFVLTGLKGAGKTTTLHAMTLKAARTALADASAPLPVLLDVALWKDGAKLQKVLQNSTDFDLKPTLQQNDYVLFIDNLELTGGRNWQFLDRWLETDDTAQIVVIAADASRYNDELGLPIVSLDRLSVATMGIWQTQYPDFGDEPDAVALDVFPSVARLPFFFEIALSLHRAGEPIPTNAGRLLQVEIIRRLQSEADATEIIGKFAELAAAVIDDEEPVNFDANWAAGKLSGKSGGFLRRRAGDENSDRLLQVAVRTGLIARGDGTIRFQHPYIHDYFAAEALKKQGLGATLRPPDFDAGRRLPGKWDNAVLMACQLLENADAMVRDVMLTDPFLAALCIVNGSVVSDEVTGVVRAALVEQLELNDWRVVRPAIQSLRLIGETELLELMIENVAYGDVYQRRMSARVLGEIGHPAAVPLLAEALHDETVRNAAQEALVTIGAPATDEVAKLLDAKVAERWETRAAAAQILRSIGSVDAAHALVSALYDEEREVRWSVANALSELGEGSVHDLLDVVYDDRALRNDDIIVAAASAVVWMDDEGALGQLVDVLKDANPVRRARVAEVLGGTTSLIVVEPLIACLQDTTIVELDEEMLPIAEIVAESLEEIGTPEALAAVGRWRQGEV